MNPSSASLESLYQTQSGPAWSNLKVTHHHGFVVPLFSIHTEHSKGIGEFLDLRKVIDLARQCHMDMVQLLPINDTGNDSSPYNSISAFALNPIHLSLHALPYLEEFDDLQNQLQYLHLLTHKRTIDYVEVRKKKFRFLTEYLEKLGDKILISSGYLQFVQTQRWVEPYALFKVFTEEFGTPNWEEWPMEYRNPNLRDWDIWKQQFASKMSFHMVIQHLCDHQMSQVKAHAQEQGCYIKGDIPILISRCSADVWAHRYLFNLEYAAGAPPDMYSQEGQYWGFPLYNWDELAKTDYSWWKDRVKVASRYYHLYRLDHIVGFFRIWAIPQGDKAINGHFHPKDTGIWIEQGKKLLSMLIDAAPQMLPIGEDLGVIPDGVRETMRNLGICGTKVIRWEKRWNSDGAFIPIDQYLSESMCTVSTHDSESLKEWTLSQEKDVLELRKINGFLQWELEDQNRFFKEFLALSHHTNSLFHINLLTEYLALFPTFLWEPDELVRINTPGIVADSNWSYRIKPTMELLLADPILSQEVHQMITTPTSLHL